MSRVLACATLLLIAACNSPHPRFHGVEPVRISIGQSLFDVRVKGRAAEAIRVNPEWAPRMEAVAPRAIMAIETVSGCTVTRLDGDQAQAFARLECGGAPAPAPKPPAPVIHDCAIEDAYASPGLGEAITEMTCTPRPG